MADDRDLIEEYESFEDDDEPCSDCGKGGYECQCWKFDECGLDSEGYCQLAGTEFCDFECPLRDD